MSLSCIYVVIHLTSIFVPLQYAMIIRNLALYDPHSWSVLHSGVSKMAGNFVEITAQSTKHQSSNWAFPSSPAGKNGDDRRFWSFTTSFERFWYRYFCWSKWNQGSNLFKVSRFFLGVCYSYAFFFKQIDMYNWKHPTVWF